MKNLITRLMKKIEREISYTSSERYIKWLRKNGVCVGNNVKFYKPSSAIIDITRPSLLIIGNNVSITQGVIILTHGADWSVLRNIHHEVISSSGPVKIEDNVFIGMRSIILKGITVGKNSIIGAGSVVTKNIPPESVAAGNPAKVLCSIDEYYIKRKSHYINEAKVYARSIKNKYNRSPLPSDFHEEFPLFLQKEEDPKDIPIRNQLKGSYNYYRSHHEPVYACFEDFIKDIEE